jgi:uncharacterized protein YjbJ (UPF0337 family)
LFLNKKGGSFFLTEAKSKVMNQDILKGQWKQLKGEIRNQWGRFTHNQDDQVKGELEKLVGRIQVRYGRSREEVRNEVEAYLQHHSMRTY